MLAHKPDPADDLMAEGIPVYQTRGLALFCRRLWFAGMAIAGAAAPMQHMVPSRAAGSVWQAA